MIEPLEMTIAVVTPTYLPDLARCELLVESMERMAPSIPHYLIVDHCDMTAFSHLQRGQHRIIASEQILGKWIIRSPGKRAYWLSLKAPPVRGWIIQQILKIGILDFIPEQTLIFCDSDTAFFRPFDRNNLLVNGKIGLLDVDDVDANTRRWTISARGLLGLPAHNDQFRNHVGNMICWNRDLIKALRERIESRSSVAWKVVLARALSFSEYILYGVYVREMLGYDKADHAPSTVPLVKPSWGISLTNDAAINKFFRDFDPQTVAVMIHSRDGIDAARYRPQLERLWKANESA